MSYEVNYRSEENVDEEPSTGYAGTKAECTIGDLSPGSKYSFSVRAANEVGVSFTLGYIYCFTPFRNV